jgi:hypothetical protein
VNLLHGQSSTAQRQKRQKRLATGRRLVLVDIENIAGGACVNAQPVLWVKWVLSDLLKLSDHDHVVVGTSHIGLVEVGVNWRGVRPVVRSGPNGADLALLDVLADEHVADRYEQVVVVSGDGIFTSAVSALAADGIPTTVVGRRGSVARTLRLAASRVLYVPEPNPSTGGSVVA